LNWTQGRERKKKESRPLKETAERGCLKKRRRRKDATYVPGKVVANVAKNREIILKKTKCRLSVRGPGRLKTEGRECGITRRGKRCALG